MSKHAFQGKRPTFIPMVADVEHALDSYSTEELLAAAYNKLRSDEEVLVQEGENHPDDIRNCRNASRHILSAIALGDLTTIENAIDVSEKLERDLKQQQEEEKLSPMEYFIKHNNTTR